MTQPQIESLDNPLLREFAEKSQVMHRGDFGMTVYGGVSLAEFAELIILECMYQGRRAQINDQIVDAAIKDHFGAIE